MRYSRVSCKKQLELERVEGRKPAGEREMLPSRRKGREGIVSSRKTAKRGRRRSKNKSVCVDCARSGEGRVEGRLSGRRWIAVSIKGDACRIETNDGKRRLALRVDGAVGIGELVERLFRSRHLFPGANRS